MVIYKNTLLVSSSTLWSAPSWGLSTIQAGAWHSCPTPSAPFVLHPFNPFQGPGITNVFSVSTISTSQNVIQMASHNMLAVESDLTPSRMCLRPTHANTSMTSLSVAEWELSHHKKTPVCLSVTTWLTPELFIVWVIMNKAANISVEVCMFVFSRHPP